MILLNQVKCESNSFLKTLKSCSVLIGRSGILTNVSFCATVHYHKSNACEIQYMIKQEDYIQYHHQTSSIS